MINEKLSITLKILTNYPLTRGDGHGHFLNKVYETIHKNEPVDFTKFNAESWTRAKRKVLEQNPSLDMRTHITKECEDIVKSEVR
jgi:hypothetical protein